MLSQTSNAEKCVPRCRRELRAVRASGRASGRSAHLSHSELDALRARLLQCWSPPPGVEATTEIYVVLRVLLKPDGSLAHDATVVEELPSPLVPARQGEAGAAAVPAVYDAQTRALRTVEGHLPQVRPTRAAR
jgi:hypothetical protein